MLYKINDNPTQKFVSEQNLNYYAHFYTSNQIPYKIVEQLNNV